MPKKITIALLSFVATLAVAEIGLRLLRIAPAVKPIELSGEATVYKRSSDPILGFELKADYRNDDADLVTSYPSTNSHGQRDVERAIDKQPGTERIILLGDSVVEGERLRDIDDLMSRQLERLFDDGTEVLNFGVSGYCTRAEIELLETKGLRFDPDVVVLVFVDNDFDNFNLELSDPDSARHRPRLVKFLFLRSHLFRLAAIRLNLFGFGDDANPRRAGRSAIGDNNVVEGLRRLRELADAHGFEPLIAIWPGFRDDGIVDGPFMPGSEDDLVIERLARMFGLPAVRMSISFRAHHASLADARSPRLLYTTDGDTMHPSVEGSRVAALALKRALDRAEDQRREAAGARQVVDDPAAVEVARRLSRADPEDAAARINLGRALRDAGRTDEAVANYRRAVAISPNNPLPHFNLANALRAQGKLDEAILHYREALRVGSDDAIMQSVHTNLATALFERGQTEEAERHFREAQRLAPHALEPNLNLATALSRLGRPAEAVEVYRQALEISPDSGNVQFGLALALARIGRVDEAIGHLRQAMRVAPDLPGPIAYLAWILATHPDDGLRNPPEALRLALRAVAMTQGRDAPTLDALAAAYAASGDFERAVQTADQAIAAAGSSAPGIDAYRRRRALYARGEPYYLPPPPGAGSR
jgi:tetratricopeptide (TPR) repeat protein